MKITVKTLNKGAGGAGKPDGNFEIDIEPTDTILQVKQKIETVKSDYEAAGQKLICAGRILQNDKTVADSSLKEGDFLVVIPAKKPAAEAPAAPAAAAPAAPAAGETPAAGGAPAAPSAPVAPGIAAAPVSSNREAEAAITQLQEMGFPRDQCEAALRAAFGNPDRAVEYLMTGIPANLQEQASGAPPAAVQPAGAGPPGTQPAGAAPAAPAPAASGGEGFQGMAFPAMGGAAAPPAGGAAGGAAAPAAGGAAAIPGAEGGQMAELQAAIAQNPAMLQQVLAQIGQTNPELLAMLQQNPQALMQILAGGMGGEGMEGEDDPMGGLPGGGAAAPGAGGGAPGGQIQIELSEQDRAAVERLEQLGFPRAAVVQAYMAAEKNEELAANLLFDMGDDF